MRAWTESYILSRIRATLRRLSIQMPAARICRLNARRAYTAGVNPRQKYEVQCSRCKEWFSDKFIDVDHVEPAGSLRSFDDVGPFARRLLFPGPDGLRCLCKECHKARHREEKAALKAKKLPII